VSTKHLHRIEVVRDDGVVLQVCGVATGASVLLDIHTGLKWHVRESCNGVPVKNHAQTPEVFIGSCDLPDKIPPTPSRWITDGLVIESARKLEVHEMSCVLANRRHRQNATNINIITEHTLGDGTVVTVRAVEEVPVRRRQRSAGALT
jgi:hypothetical protein